MRAETQLFLACLVTGVALPMAFALRPAASDTASTTKSSKEPAAIFAPFSYVETHSNADTLFIESDGLARHQMMVGIKSWQQQVPLPQPYTGSNAWQVPLKPELADKPISAKTSLYRGAIAIAANGVPIFNALNNRGEDTLKAGELDDFGGHCGRADDYHYHVAPLHLAKALPEGSAIAYALDGYAIYGLWDKDHPCPMGGTAKLDELNGHFGADGVYHYHGTLTFPYINGGMRGKVTVRNDGIEPQPRAEPIRPAGQPLRGAIITGFTTAKTGGSVLEYKLDGKTGKVEFSKQDNGYVFTFTSPAGEVRTETYRPRPRR